MNPTYNLLKEPWIPAIRDGETVEMNIRDVLYSAHKISAISDPLPIAEFGLYRFLVALVMDVYHLKDSRDLEDLLETGQFDPTRIDDYFREWGHCFGLFDPKQPFLQTPDMCAFSDKPLSELLPAIPSSSNANHFHHFSEEAFGVSPAVAARLLTTIAPFACAGGRSWSPSINGAPPWYVLINGDDLFQTICMNCFAGNRASLGLQGNAHPAWRNMVPPRCDGRSTKVSLSEALTWRPRRIRLIPGGPGVCSVSGAQSSLLVQTMKFQPGASCDFKWTDPSVPYRASDKKKEPVAMRPQEGKELWRDTGPLALLNDRAYGSSDAKVKFARPRLIDQFEGLFRYEDKPLSLTIYGIRTDQAKVFEWQKEKLRVPAELVIGSKFALFAQDCIDEAGSVESALRKAIKHLARDDGKGNANALDTLIDNATRQYWSTLRPDYLELLERLAALPKDEHAEARFPLQDEWREKERRIVMDVFSEASDGLDTYGDNIQRQVEAERNLRLNLGRIFETIEQKDARKKKSKADNILAEGGDKQ